MNPTGARDHFVFGRKPFRSTEGTFLLRIFIRQVGWQSIGRTR